MVDDRSLLLLAAAWNGRVKEATWNGPEIPSFQIPWRSLHYAVMFGNAAIVQLLLDEGTHLSLEAKTKNGYTRNPGP
jgi:hypothetical protein